MSKEKTKSKFINCVSGLKHITETFKSELDTLTKKIDALHMNALANKHKVEEIDKISLDLQGMQEYRMSHMFIMLGAITALHAVLEELKNES